MNLSPGGIVTIARTKSAHVEVSRSGDGKTLMFVRHTENSSVVFKRCAF